MTLECMITLKFTVDAEDSADLRIALASLGDVMGVQAEDGLFLAGWPEASEALIAGDVRENEFIGDIDHMVIEHQIAETPSTRILIDFDEDTYTGKVHYTPTWFEVAPVTFDYGPSPTWPTPTERRDLVADAVRTLLQNADEHLSGESVESEEKPTMTRAPHIRGQERIVDIIGVPVRVKNLLAREGIVTRQQLGDADFARKHLTTWRNCRDEDATAILALQHEVIAGAGNLRGVDAYCNNLPDDPNPGIVIDLHERQGKPLTPSEARTLAETLHMLAAEMEEPS